MVPWYMYIYIYIWRDFWIFYFFLIRVKDHTCISLYHCSQVTWVSRWLRSLATGLYVQLFVFDDIKENIKTCDSVKINRSPTHWYWPIHCGDQRHAGWCLGRRPCTSRRRVQGRSQGTTLSASDLHNARAKYDVNRSGHSINLTPNRYNALAPAIVYVSNDVTIPFNSVMSQ